jgi:predicted neuraminidase
MRLIATLACLAMTASATAELVTTHVIGPEFPGQYKHPASITELENGDLYLAYYGGGGEYEDDSCVWGMRLPKGEDEWTTPEIIADTPFLAEGNPVVWQEPGGPVWLFYVQRYGETWSDSRVKGKISNDNAETWSDNFIVAYELGTMVQGRPEPLPRGGFLLPVYHETGHDHNIVGSDTCSFFLRWHPDTQTWSETQRIYSRTGNLQIAAANLRNGKFVGYARRGGGYDPVDDGWVVRSESLDGQRWTSGEDSEFPNPNAAISFIGLQSGNLLMVYNHSMSGRTPLVAALSEDDDQSYPHRRIVGAGDNTFAYPYLIQQQDGTIRLIYTTNSRSTIKMVTFTEDAIIGHADDLPELPAKE